MMRCTCGNVLDRDRNAAVNHYRYSKEWENRASDGATRVETGDQVDGASRLQVLVVETQTPANIVSA